jgi:hypothetical protein
MYRQFNIQQFYVLPTLCIYVFCVDLRTNSDYFPIQHSLAGFYNRDGVCLLRGTHSVFLVYTADLHTPNCTMYKLMVHLSFLSIKHNLLTSHMQATFFAWLHF